MGVSAFRLLENDCVNLNNSRFLLILVSYLRTAKRLGRDCRLLFTLPWWLGWFQTRACALNI